MLRKLFPLALLALYGCGGTNDITINSNTFSQKDIELIQANNYGITTKAVVIPASSIEFLKKVSIKSSEFESFLQSPYNKELSYDPVVYSKELKMHYDAFQRKFSDFIRYEGSKAQVEVYTSDTVIKTLRNQLMELDSNYKEYMEVSGDKRENLDKMRKELDKEMALLNQAKNNILAELGLGEDSLRYLNVPIMSGYDCKTIDESLMKGKFIKSSYHYESINCIGFDINRTISAFSQSKIDDYIKSYFMAYKSVFGLESIGIKGKGIAYRYNDLFNEIKKAEYYLDRDSNSNYNEIVAKRTVISEEIEKKEKEKASRVEEVTNYIKNKSFNDEKNAELSHIYLSMRSTFEQSYAAIARSKVLGGTSVSGVTLPMQLSEVDGEYYLLVNRVVLSGENAIASDIWLIPSRQIISEQIELKSFNPIFSLKGEESSKNALTYLITNYVRNL